MKIFKFIEKNKKTILIVNTVLFFVFCFSFFYLSNRTFNTTFGPSVIGQAQTLFTALINSEEPLPQYFCAFFGYLTIIFLLLSCLINESKCQAILLLIAFGFSIFFFLFNIAAFSEFSTAYSSSSGLLGCCLSEIFFQSRNIFFTLSLIVCFLTSASTAIFAKCIFESKPKKTNFLYIKLTLGLAFILVLLFI